MLQKKIIEQWTIEYLENPRAFMREVVRLRKLGGWLIVTTPNQLSLLSKLTLILKNQFSAFQEAPGLYPAPITALLEIDLIRIAKEYELIDINTDYSNQGRILFTHGTDRQDWVFADGHLATTSACEVESHKTSTQPLAKTELLKFFVLILNL